MASLAVPVALLATALAFAGCARSVPLPRTGPAPDQSDIEVPYPPPAAKVETIPEQKDAAQVWVDGQWDWSIDEWVWRGGEWTTPPSAEAYFTPWSTVRKKDGRLFFIPAAWRDARGAALTKSGAGCPAPARKEP